MKHLKGKDNSVADFLSRNPVKTVAVLLADKYTSRDMKIMQRADPEIKNIVHKFLGLEEMDTGTRDDYQLQRIVLYKKNRGTGRNLLLVEERFVGER